MNASLLLSWCRRLAFALLCNGLAMAHYGCAVAESSLDEVGSQIQEGLQGRGRLVPNNPTSDSFGPSY